MGIMGSARKGARAASVAGVWTGALWLTACMQAEPLAGADALERSEGVEKQERALDGDVAPSRGEKSGTAQDDVESAGQNARDDQEAAAGESAKSGESAKAGRGEAPGGEPAMVGVGSQGGNAEEASAASSSGEQEVKAVANDDSAANLSAAESDALSTSEHAACGCDDPAVLRAELGNKLFHDTALSASGTMSCASCHAAEQAHAGNNNPSDPLFPVSTGAFPDLLGTRNTPSARYAAFSPRFGIEPMVEEGEAEVEYVPVGGQFWDGRAATLDDQAGGPFINPREMAMPDKASVIEVVRAAEYAPLFVRVFGEGSLDNVEEAYFFLTEAIRTFEQTEVFSPFDSKFDAYLRGQLALSEQEAWGMSLFNDPEKGNCIACHVGDLDSHEPSDWLFTDFTYDNIGVPRNYRIPENQDSEFFDLGLCQQEGLRDRVPMVIEDVDGYVEGLCGAFKVPTLRNAAATAPYMHNGRFETLREVVDFYVTRDTHPEKWYPGDEGGSVYKFDDVPERLHDNVNTDEVPMDRKPGEEPRLTADEIDAVVAFIETLTDGYQQ